jgi:CDP-diacylglycerol--glycerol-3-phosphate 3-phosphatidyltransferase
MQHKEIFTLSNLISLVRLFFAIPIYYYISIEENIMALFWVVLAMISDSLDGYFARKWDQITDVGKIIDPLADKTCTISGFLALSIYQGLPLWITFVIIARDILIIIAALFMIRQKSVVLPSNIPGKITVLIITALGVVYLLKLDSFKYPLIILSALAILYSITNYAFVFFKNLSQNES